MQQAITSRHFWLALAIAFQVLSTAHSQPIFQELLAKREEHCSQLRSYTARVVVLAYGEEKIDDFEYQYLNRTVYEIIADRTTGSVLICRNSFPYAADSHSSLTSIFLKQRDRSYVSIGSQFQEQALRTAGIGYFDPTVIGLGFCAEIGNFKSFDDVIEGFRRWDTHGWRQSESGDAITFGNGDGSSNPKVTFDKAKGYAPTSISFPEANGLTISCDYEEKDGIWLPKFARYKCNPKHSLIIEVEWIAINNPIPSTVFTPAAVASMTGLETAEAAEIPESIREFLREATESGGRIAADKSVATLGNLQQEQTYRRLLSPLADLTVRNQLQINDEQFQLYQQEVSADSQFLYPSFAGLEGTQKERENYFSILLEKREKADRKFFEYWDEALLPAQSDSLLAIEIVRNGLRAFTHPALKSRLKLSDAQAEKLREEIELLKEKSRDIWGNLHTLPARLPEKTIAAVEHAMDLKSGREVALIAKMLTEQQTVTLREILSKTPTQLQPRLTMGL